MRVEHQVDQIISKHLPDILTGTETVESVAARYPRLSQELRPQLEAVLWMEHARQEVNPRAGFVAASRKYLETQIESQRYPGIWQRLVTRYSPQRWVFNLVSPIIILLLVSMVINSAVLTARLAIPGDPFYSTKLFIENVQLTFTSDPVEKTALYSTFSRERTTEVVELVLVGDYQDLPAATDRLENEIIATIHSMNRIPVREQSLEQHMTTKLRETLSSEILMLNVLKQSIPPSAAPEIDLAIRVAQMGLLAFR